VPISAIIFGGRRQHLAPLVYEAFNWQHGVFIGAAMASERTAAQVGKLGEVRRDPMAMLPFCGYNMADYFSHWLEMGKRMSKPPKVFHVNWFRSDENGRLLWPGFGENLRVLEWILDRCNDKVEAIKTPIGYIPRQSEIDMTGLQLSDGALEKLLAVHKEDWLEELKGIKKFFRQFKKDLPAELWQEYEALSSRLK
jgi:phosphoenolpyruvate carboxykinase (GTP)